MGAHDDQVGRPLLRARRDDVRRLAELDERGMAHAGAVELGLRRREELLALVAQRLLDPADLVIPADKFEAASRSDVVILSGPTSDHVRAMVHLDGEADTFLVTSRAVDARVIQHMDTTAGAAALYEQLEGRRLNIQTIFSLIFIVIALLLLFGAIWGALIELTGSVCPLTPLEVALRQQAGQAGYAGGFIEHYVAGLIYPGGLSRSIQVFLGLFVLGLNGVVYQRLWRRETRPAPGP